MVTLLVIGFLIFPSLLISSFVTLIYLSSIYGCYVSLFFHIWQMPPLILLNIDFVKLYKNVDKDIRPQQNITPNQ